MKCLSILGVVAVFVLGYLLGSYGREPEQESKTQYVLGQAIRVGFDNPFLLSENLPAAPKYLFYTDTVTGLTVVDTAAIISDWIQERKYRQEIFNVDTVGKLDVEATVQYNQLQNMTADFTPVQKTTVSVVVKAKKWQPYAMVGVGTTYSIEGGVFYKNIGVGVEFTGTNDKLIKVAYRF
jgi:hypothetical protein